jgi:hypothetical protein
LVAAEPPESGWFEQLLAVLTAHGYNPAPGETPREFATATADALRQRMPAVADVPIEWVEAYYRSRFGGVPIPAGDHTTLERRLAELQSALRNT